MPRICSHVPLSSKLILSPHRHVHGLWPPCHWKCSYLDVVMRLYVILGLLLSRLVLSPGKNRVELLMDVLSSENMKKLMEASFLVFSYHSYNTTNRSWSTMFWDWVLILIENKQNLCGINIILFQASSLVLGNLSGISFLSFRIKNWLEKCVLLILMLSCCLCLSGLRRTLAKKYMPLKLLIWKNRKYFVFLYVFYSVSNM